MRTRDGRRLFSERAGVGHPVVVFESGMGQSRNAWAAVAPPISEHTSTLLYDRSGLGRSPADSAGRSLARLVDDLVDIIDDLSNVLGDVPVVLVGFSWGGPIVRGAAAQRPERIDGLVLVDPTDEHCDPLISTTNERLERWSRPVVRALGETGLARLVVKRQARSLAPATVARVLAEDGTRSATRTYLREVAPSIGDLRRLRMHPWPVPDVPLTIVSGGRHAGKPTGRRAALVAAHAALAASVAEGRHVLAPNSSHLVPFTDPDVVVTEVLRMVDADRTRSQRRRT